MGEEGLQRLIKGIELFDRNAEESIYRMYLAKWEYFLYQWGTPRDAIKDIIQETFLALIEEIRDTKRKKIKKQRKEIRHFSAYTRGILHRKYVDYLKKYFHNPDLNRLFLRKSRIKRGIEDIKGRIKELKSDSSGSTKLAQLRTRMDILMTEENHISEEIVELKKKIGEASQKENILGDTSPDQEQVLKEKQENEVINKAIRETLSEFSEVWQRDLIKDRLYGKMTYKVLADKYGIKSQKGRYIYQTFIKIVGGKLPGKEDIL